MKAALLGAGFIAAIHGRTLQEQGIPLLFVCDPNPTRSAAFTAGFGGRPGTLNDIIESDADCVHVCTPPATHLEIVRSLLKAGKNVLCEKPLCLDPEEAAELAALANTSKLVCAVNFNIRYHFPCQKARELVSHGELGRVLFLHGTYLQEFHALPAPLDWRYNESLAGKMRAVTEIGSHFFDLASYLSHQKITAVCAQFGCFHPERRLEKRIMNFPSGNGDIIHVSSEDAASVMLRFENGAIGSVFLSELSHGRSNRLSIELTGENASIWWNSEENNTLTVAKKGYGATQRVFPFEGGFNDTFRALFLEVYEEIRRGYPSVHPTYPTFTDGAVSAAICSAVYQSALAGSVWVCPGEVTK